MGCASSKSNNFEDAAEEVAASEEAERKLLTLLLDDFCRLIISDISDVAIVNEQSAYNCRDLLKNCLPLDSASSREVEVISQLITSRGQMRSSRP
jgi:hypothetical protein